MDNANSQDYLQKIKIQVIENLRQTTFAPSVQITDVPRDPEGMNDEADAEMDDLDEDENPDSRYTKRRWDKYIEKDGEPSDSEDEEENAANGVRRQPNGAKRRRNMMDYQNPLAAPDDLMPSGAASVRSGRSQANGVGGSSHSELSENEAEDEAEDNDRREDEDVDMTDGGALDGTTITATAEGDASTRAQAVTPPESPAAEATAPAHVVQDTGNEAMDEGDVVDGDGDQKEEGRESREMEDIDAEAAKEGVERRDEA